jgi:integrase
MAKSHRTWLAYDLALRLFQADCRKAYLEDVDRKDLLHFISYLKSLGQGPRTAANTIQNVKAFFLSRERQWPLKKTDRVRYTEPMVKTYTKQDIARLMAVAEVDERDLFQFFLCTGAREKEVAHATWRDVDLDDRTFSITEKRDSKLQFTTKDHEEGIVPLPDLTVTLLVDRRKRYPTGRLIFPGKDSKAEGHFLRTLKKLALRGGLNCGHCTNKKEAPAQRNLSVTFGSCTGSGGLLLSTFRGRGARPDNPAVAQGILILTPRKISSQQR